MPLGNSNAQGSQASLARVLLWVTPALWSSNYVIARAAHDVVAPHQLAFGRWLLVLILLLPLIWPARLKIREAMGREWRQMLVLGGLGMWICGAFVYIGAQSTTATNIGLIYAAAPVGIAVASRWLLHEQVSAWQRAAMLLALLGVLLVITRGDLSLLLQARFVTGDVWITVAAVSWVAFSILQQRWKSSLPSRERLACMTAGGLVILLPFTVIEALTTPTPPWTGHAALLIGLAGVLPGFLSYQAYSVMLRELGASRAGVVMYLSPIYAAGTSWWLLGEAPHWFHAVGAALILPSVYLASYSKKDTP